MRASETTMETSHCRIEKHHSIQELGGYTATSIGGGPHGGQDKLIASGTREAMKAVARLCGFLAVIVYD